MRSLSMVLLLGQVLAGAAQEGPNLNERYGVKVNLEVYPQQMPQEALQSILKAINNNRVGYLLAHLADPDFVDAKVEAYKSDFKGKEETRALLAFGRLIRETEEHFRSAPSSLKELRLFAMEGEWKTEEAAAVATAKSIFGRSLFMKKVQNRWFMENRQK